MSSTTFDFKRTVWPYAFLLVPFVGLAELAAHVHQAGGAAPLSDFARARAIVQKDLKPDDLILFAPAWDDPVGRETFGNDLITLERAAFPDVSRYPRAYEVAIRGEERPELAGWRVASETRTGKVTVRLRENPQPVHILSDLVSLLGPNVQVSRVEPHAEGEDAHEKACSWGRGGVDTGGLGHGPAMPAEHASCGGGGNVGVSVLETLDYTSRRVILASPSNGGELGGTKLHFSNVKFGQKIHGHHALYVEQERGRNGPPVLITFQHDGKTLGRAVHLDGNGWLGFEIDTSALSGQTGDLDVLVSSQDAGRRYGFEADTR